MNVGAAFEGNAATVVASGHGAAFKNGQTGAGIHQNGRIGTRVNPGKQTGRAIDRVRGLDLERTVGC